MTEWSWMGEGVLRCSLNLSAKFPAGSPMYSSSQSTLLHLYLYMTPLLFRIVSLSFGDMRRFLMVSPPFKCTWTPYLLHILLKFSLRPWWYGTTMCVLIDVRLFWPGGFGTSVVIFVGSFFSVLQLDSIQGPGWIFASLQG